MSEDTFDYIIAGGGTAGCLLANRLSKDPEVRVLLVEAGGSGQHLFIEIPLMLPKLLGNPRFDWLYKTAPEPHLGGRTLPVPRGKVLGGSSSINGMVYVRGHRWDYDNWRAQGNEGWGWSDVLPYFMRSEGWVGEDLQAHGRNGEWKISDPGMRWPVLDGYMDAADEIGVRKTHDYNCGDNEGVQYFQSLILKGRRQSSEKAFLRPAEGRPNLTVVTGAMADRVVTDGRRATIAFSTDWQEDAARRDFTMNTLLADGEGNIYDPLGQGVEDLKAGRVIFVGEARQRIAEDILRILRFFRFHALYGKGDPDEDALTACREFADKIPELSRERITQEFLKIISVDDPVDILTLMFENNILKQFNFNETKLIVLKYTCDFQRRYGLGFVASRLYALAGFSLKNVEAMENLLLLPKVFKKDMEAIDKILQLPDLNNDHAVKVAIYDHGRVPTAQALMIELATDRVMNGYVLKALEIIQNWDIPDFPLSGEDLIKEGFKPGPVLGEELTRRERAWIDNGFSQ